MDPQQNQWGWRVKMLCIRSNCFFLSSSSPWSSVLADSKTQSVTWFTACPGQHCAPDLIWQKCEIKLNYSCNKKTVLCVYIKLGRSVPCEFACVYRQLMRCIEPKKPKETAAACKGERKREFTGADLSCSISEEHRARQLSVPIWANVLLAACVSVYVLHLHNSLASCALISSWKWVWPHSSSGLTLDECILTLLPPVQSLLSL